MQSAQQLREHYEIERELAARLKSASALERRTLYSEVYDELFQRVPHHPQLTERASMDARMAAAQRQARFLVSLSPVSEPVFLEVGPGDCLTSLAMAPYCRQVYAVDVSAEITRLTDVPANFTLVLSDGCSVDVPVQSVDVAFSNQLMEHLHPDDAVAQLRNIHAALKPGGRYFIITPSRISGPHDVSQHFDPVATGFHLREYSIGELIGECRSAGFGGFRAYVGKDGLYLRVPITLVKLVEVVARSLPLRARKLAPLRLLLGLRLAATRTAQS